MAEDYSDSHSEEGRTSKYSGAIAQLYRIDDLWKDVHKHSRQGDFVKWNLDLDRLWSELSEDIKDNSPEDLEFKKINKVLADNGLFNMKRPVGFSSPSAKDLGSHGLMYVLLLRKEIFLRRLQNKQGKGAKYEDSIEDYMD